MAWTGASWSAMLPMIVLYASNSWSTSTSSGTVLQSWLSVSARCSLYLLTRRQPRSQWRWIDLDGQVTGEWSEMAPGGIAVVSSGTRSVNSTFLFHNFFSKASLTSRMLSSHRSLPGWLRISYHSIRLKSSFFIIGHKRQLDNPSTSIDTTKSARYVGLIFDEHLSFSNQISALSKSCYHHIRALPFTPPKQLPPPSYTSSLTTATLYYGLQKYLINRLQHTQNAVARTVVKAPKFQHITPILKYIHWLKVSERIEYKIICVTYKTLNTTQPPYLYDFVSIQPPYGHSTRSSPYVTLIKPSTSLKVTHRSFRHASSHLWNHLPTSLPTQRPSFEHAGLTCYTLLSPSTTFSLFHSELKLTCSENLILHLSLFLSVGLISWL